MIWALNTLTQKILLHAKLKALSTEYLCVLSLMMSRFNRNTNYGECSYTIANLILGYYIIPQDPKITDGQT